MREVRQSAVELVVITYSTVENGVLLLREAVSSSIRMAGWKTWPEGVAERRGPNGVAGRRGPEGVAERRGWKTCLPSRGLSQMVMSLMIKYFGQTGAVDRVRELWKQLTPHKLQPGPVTISCMTAALAMLCFLGVAPCERGEGQNLHQRHDLQHCSQKLRREQT